LKAERNSRNNFDLIQHIERDFAAENDVFIFVSNQLNAYTGQSPKFDKSLIINVLPSKEVSKYVEKIERKNDKEINVFFGVSDAEKTEIVRQQIRLNEKKQTRKIAAIGTVDFLWQKEKNALLIHSKDEKIDTVVSLENLGFSQKKYIIELIYEQKRQTDVRYFEAAFKTIKKYYGTEIDLKKEKMAVFEQKVLAQKKKNDKNDIEAFENIDMYIWLSQKPISDLLEKALKSGKMVLADAEKNKFEKINGLLFREKENGFQTFDYPYIYKISTEKAEKTLQKKKIWADSFGNVVLNAAVFGEKEGVFYQFHSRFHADYTNLVEQVWFPIWLNDLLEKKHLNEDKMFLQHDKTTISTDLLPLKQSDETIFVVGEKLTKEVTKSLHCPLWLIVILLFMAERFWSERKYGKKNKAF